MFLKPSASAFKKIEFNLSFSEKNAQMLRIGKQGVTGHFSDYFTSSFKSETFMYYIVLFSVD